MKIASQTVLAVAAIAAIAGGVFLLLRDSSPRGSLEVVLPTPTAAGEAEVVVYVTGAVNSPGVYAIEDGNRLVHAVEAAGGATEDADLTSINLAVQIKDEDHWHIPRLGEGPPPPRGEGTEAVPSTSDKVDINSATALELESLPQIGKVKAQAIVSYREANGSFESPEDLLEVNGIGAATLAAIEDLVEAR